MCGGEFWGKDGCIHGALHYAGKDYSGTRLKRPAGRPIWQSDQSLPELAALLMEADSSDPNVAVENLSGIATTAGASDPIGRDPYEALTEELAAAAEFARGLQLSHHWFRMLDRAGARCVDRARM